MHGKKININIIVFQIKNRIQLNPDSRKWLQRSNIVVQSCKNIRIQEASDHPIMNICFSNSNHLVVTSANCTFSVWDVKTFEMIGGVEALPSVVNALCSLPEPTHVVSNIFNCFEHFLLRLTYC